MFEDIYKLILEAKKTLSGNINNTPIFTASNLGDEVYLKMEHLQRTGSFKYRGAYNKINNLREEEKRKGVIASSAGNHAQGVAKSASLQGIKSTICIPAIAPIAKIEATKRYGAEVVLVDGVYDDSYKKARELADELDYTFIHPFDDEYVIAGQGTIGLEILEQLPNVERIIVPIGGGGLISGIAIAVKTLRPDIEVIGVEPAGADCMYESIKAGHILELDSASSIADGIAVKRPGDRTYSIIKQLVDDIIVVSDGEISESILNLLEKNKIVSEGAGAASVAALKKLNDDKITCCVLSGGNINVNVISKIIQKGLYQSGRLCEITTLLNDRPGELAGFLETLNLLGANILTINQFAEHEMNEIGTMVVRIVLETKNKAHVKQIYSILSEKGYLHYRNV